MAGLKTIRISLIIALTTVICGAMISHSTGVKSSNITFRIKNAGITVDGSFSGLKADIRFDPREPEKGSIVASVGAATINTGIDKRDRDLRQRKYFDVEKYPQIRMVSKKITLTKKDEYKGMFSLTIRNVTKEVEVPFTYSQHQDGPTFKGSFTINRRDFGVGSNSIILSDDVTVYLEVTTD